ncbi:MAG: GNAT family N-acetyltransferase [Bacteroidota bacterium]
MIQLVTPSNIKSLQTICHTAYTEHFGNHWEEGGLDIYLKEEFNLERLQKEVTHPSKAYYFIQDGEDKVGFIKINFQAELALFPQATCCELEKIYILPDQAGRGIGKRALQEIINICREKASKAIFLYVIDTNEAARLFYVKLGFKQNGTGRLNAPLFKEELRGMYRMILTLS